MEEFIREYGRVIIALIGIGAILTAAMLAGPEIGRIVGRGIG